MTSRRGWIVLCAALSVAFIAMVPYAMAQEAIIHDGHPAVECQNGKKVWSIAQVSLNGRLAFAIPVDRPSGTLYVTADRIIFEARKQKDSFDEDRAAIKWKMSRNVLLVKVARKQYIFWASTSGEEFEDFPACKSFVDLAWNDFAAAERRFHQHTKRLPPVREAAFRDFQPKAAAWRALPTKPPLSPEADRHWLLAENAFQEKNLESAVEHYEAALEIQPMWPVGWFNLAMIYGEQKQYADASDCMKRYLELVPDAPDAKSAREQMIIWEDKAKQ